MYDSIYSPWSFPRDSAEDRKKEHERWRSLTPQQRSEEWEIFCEKVRKESEERETQKLKEQQKRSAESDEYLYIHAEHPHSLDDGEATVSWIIIMIVGSIFNDRLLIWIMATAIYLGHIFRYEIRRWKWKNGGKEEYYKRIEDAFKGDKK